MSKKSISVFVLVFFFFGFNLARADVVINEIAWMGTEMSQYEEWVELKNTDSESVSLVGWKLYKNSGTLLFSLSKTIPAGGYFLICRTTPSVSNPLSGICDEQGIFGGSGLNNTSDLVQLKNASGTEIDLADGIDGWPAGDAITKETMQLDGSSWITASPTPGEENDAVTSQPADDSGSSESSSSSSSSSSVNTPEPKTKVVENPTMKAKILASTLAFTGQPLEMKTNILGFSNENVVLGRAFWNFGDGGSLAQVDNFEKFYHTYYYPGEYVLFLEYYQNSFSKTPEATSKIIIKVLSMTVTISKIGDAKDFFIELSNNASSDIDISNWVINAGGKIFILPKNSVIMSKKQMTISSKLTGFTYGDQPDLKLFSSTGELVFDYSSPIKPVKILTKNSVPIKISTVVKPLEGMSSGGQIPTEDLSALPIASLGGSASALNNGILGQEGKSSYLSPFIPIASFIFIGVGATGAYLIRRKKVISQVGSDFEILDE